jgi:hypothetical protein
MLPIGAMPSSTRPTTTFTSTNTKNIAGKNAPAFQQRQGFSIPALDVLKHTVNIIVDEVKKNSITAEEIEQAIIKLENKILVIVDYYISCLADTGWASLSSKKKKDHYFKEHKVWNEKSPEFFPQTNRKTGIQSAIRQFDQPSQHGGKKTPVNVLLQQFEAFRTEIIDLIERLRQYSKNPTDKALLEPQKVDRRVNFT